MQLCVLATRIRTSRSPKNVIDLMGNHMSCQNPLRALFRLKQRAEKSLEISLWVAVALRDSCNTR